MTIWYTSDLHFDHLNIIEYCNRPYSDVQSMNEDLLERFNSVVKPTDVTYFLGDIAMGNRKDGLEYIKQMHGNKVLVLGNHDYPHPVHNLKIIKKWTPIYKEAFDSIISTNHIDQVWTDGLKMRLCHFPAEFEYNGDNKFSPYKPDLENADWVLCGHVHNSWKFKPQYRSINVGTDVWDYKPVNREQIMELINSGFKEI